MTSMTCGTHHIGLTVSKLEESARFFVDLLGWKEVKRNPAYPAIFVSDGRIMLTLWEVRTDSAITFDRKRNVGLHHLALALDKEADLNAVYQRMMDAGVEVEFAPEKIGEGPAKHMMCFEPSGIRIEFFWPGH
ncbi:MULTISPECIES: VOC family protein [Vibrio]|uniref:Putative dioxygenase n=1 Tax=Vibrio proteolyticus NBRC 13287 TaxID=1219065 RepID=U3A229_VIBPR|nr:MULTISPECIES: VOC family protein [Vibrio]NAW58870.1 VOC family protein [Vibrio sp. V36_P2S2PM302]NAX27334.1 VOC family protein [Vibrio sp. V38_P2S17PM301]NAX29448.1 VOC family protein [Vibrio sp. V37_P2S8PM304]GAD67382.1 putative dioxygenase [Vibrio proteolyticus NBRC 13287]